MLAQIYTFGWLSLALAQQPSAKKQNKKESGLCSDSVEFVFIFYNLNHLQ